MTDPARNDARWRLHHEIIRPEWVDYNGHMNVAYYVLIFDHATDAVLDTLDLGEAYRRRSGRSIFVAEAHVTYERELREGAHVAIDSRLIGCDDKRLILFHEMTHPDAGGPAATNEVLCVHVDLAARRSAPMPPDAAARLRETMMRHTRAGLPRRAGRAIGLGVRRPG